MRRNVRFKGEGGCAWWRGWKADREDLEMQGIGRGGGASFKV